MKCVVVQVALDGLGHDGREFVDERACPDLRGRALPRFGQTHWESASAPSLHSRRPARVADRGANDSRVVLVSPLVWLWSRRSAQRARSRGPVEAHGDRADSEQPRWTATSLTIAEMEEDPSVVLGRVRAVWKETAASLLPELQPVGYEILGTLVQVGEAKASALADMRETDGSVVSRQLRTLEEAGFVVSRADPKDCRARVLSETPVAIERVRAVRYQQQDRLRDILRSQPESEVRAFAAMLRVIGEA